MGCNTRKYDGFETKGSVEVFLVMTKRTPVVPRYTTHTWLGQFSVENLHLCVLKLVYSCIVVLVWLGGLDSSVLVY